MKKRAGASWIFSFAVALTGAGDAAAAAPLRVSFDLQVPAAPTPVIVSGTPRLVYELHLTNFAQTTLVVQRVQVIDAGSGAVVADLRDEALDARLARVGQRSGEQDKRALPAGMRAVLYLEVTPGVRDLPRALNHRVEYTAAGSSDRDSSFVEGGRISVARESPVSLGAPLRGGPWLAIYGPAWERGHRRMVYAVDGRARIPGRFAIDWVKLDADGHTVVGDGVKTGDSLGYAEDVLAVADSVVAAVRDDVPESATVADHPKSALEDASGNYVALNLGHGRFAFYEHLKPGSVRVRTGQRVRRGQAIAALGFTGDSTGPHLHFHVADADTPLGAEGQPFVLLAFTVLGSYDSLETLGKKMWTPLTNPAEAQRHAELPAPNVVVEFDNVGPQ